MKSAGIFTYMHSNYGAILQAFSLQSFLRENGVDAEVVDYATNYHTVDYHLKDSKLIRFYRKGNPLRDSVCFFLKVLRYRQLNRRKERTLLFKEHNFHYTQRYSTTEELISNPPKKDLYITGSDQVFALDNIHFKDAYYLPFEKKGSKKVAYAPSFGVSTFGDKYNSVKDYLLDFDYLSCRESEGAKFIESIVERNVPVVVDPVLLHDAVFWSGYAVQPKIKGDYILVYNLNGKGKLMRIAYELRKKTGYKVVCLTGDTNQLYKTKMIFDAGPAEFIGWFANASMIVTDSFHGTVFSLVFSKQFYSYVALARTSSRVGNLLSSVGLSSRIIRDFNKDILNQDPIDYSKVNLVEVSKPSKEYIKSFIQ
ncbi:MAG: polysaccharide pyruvyl transferase family protein [Prevotellaceae bacterium]|nr:polysaccharide pyruvyl transferase family protein [Candidatus Faecinaster equi]